MAGRRSYFGPRRKEESLKKKINQNKTEGLAMILAKREDQEIKIIDSFNGLDIKTKVMDQLLKTLSLLKEKLLPPW